MKKKTKNDLMFSLKASGTAILLLVIGWVIVDLIKGNFNLGTIIASLGIGVVIFILLFITLFIDLLLFSEVKVLGWVSATFLTLFFFLMLPTMYILIFNKDIQLIKEFKIVPIYGLLMIYNLIALFIKSKGDVI